MLTKVGLVCVGVLIGALVAWLFNYRRGVAPSALLAAIVLLVGATAVPIVYLIETTYDIPDQYWWYLIGLCVGIVGMTARAIREWGYDG